MFGLFLVLCKQMDFSPSQLQLFILPLHFPLSHTRLQDPMLFPLHSRESIPLDAGGETVTVLLLLALLEVSLQQRGKHAKTIKSVS